MRTNLVCNLYFPDPPDIVSAAEIENIKRIIVGNGFIRSVFCLKDNFCLF